MIVAPKREKDYAATIRILRPIAWFVAAMMAMFVLQYI